MADLTAQDADGGGEAAPVPLQAMLDAARAAGGTATDPTRWQRLEALARRAEAHHGATRALLAARLQALLAQLAQPAADPGNTPAAVTAPRPSPAEALRALRTPLESVRSDASDTAAPTRSAGASAAPRDLKTVQQHRAAWTQLRAEQRVAQAHTALPDQAGPLNSQLLLHRALTLMRETAPGYLQHFMGQAEALMWLEISITQNLQPQTQLAKRLSSESNVRRSTRTRKR